MGLLLSGNRHVSELVSAPVAEPVEAAGSTAPAWPGVPVRAVASAVAGGAAALILCAVTAIAYPYFRVPEEYGFGMSPPPEVVAAWKVQQHRVDTLNSMVTFGIGGSLLGLSLATVGNGYKFRKVNPAIGLAGGMVW